MTFQKLRRLQRELGSLRAAKHNITAYDLIRLAQSLGRRKQKRGKHPTYVNDLIPVSRPISIPGHPGTIKGYTALSILDDLELDIQRFFEMLEEGEQTPNEQKQRKALPPATLRTDSDSR